MTEPTPTPDGGEAAAGPRARIGAFAFYLYAGLVVAGVAIAEHVMDAQIATQIATPDADGSPFAGLTGLTIAVLGLGFYLAAFALIVVWRFVAGLRGPLAGVALLGGAASVLCSLVLAGLGAVGVGAPCPPCVGLYAVNIGLLVTAALTHPAGWRAAFVTLPATLTPAVLGASAALLVATTAAACGLYGGRLDAAARDEPPPTVEPAVVVDVGDAPGRGAERPALTVVVFGDFECPDCKALAVALGAAAERLPVRYAFKHFPLDAQCNRAVRETAHPDACLAATAMVCARRLAGDDQGWAMHDLLFAQTEHDRAALLGLAGQLGLDLRHFDACLGDRMALADVRRDVEQGVGLGIQGIPTWFVNGHRVTSAVRPEVVEPILERFLRVRLGPATRLRR